MSLPTGSVWLGDVIRVVSALGRDDPDRRIEVARLLGFMPASDSDARPSDDIELTTPSQVGDAAPDPVAAPLVELLDPLLGSHNVATPAAPAAPFKHTAVGVTIPVTRTEPCDWYDPLLDHTTANRTLRAALRTWSEYRMISPRRAVAHTARLLPADRLPRQYRQSFRKGGQLVFDLGPAMGPFARDMQDLVDRVHRLARRRIDVVGLREVPPRSVLADDGRRVQWRTYRPPPRGAPVLILGALGTAGPRSDPWVPLAEDWAEFVTELKHRRHRVAVLSPMSPAHLPGEVGRIATMIHWDDRSANWAASALRADKPRMS